MKTAELSDLGQRIAQGKIPVSVTIELTEKCCFECIHCARNIKKHTQQDIKKEKWIEVIDHLADSGTLELTFTGGEPLMYTHHEALLEYASEKGFAITLFSNAWLLDRKKLAFLKRIRLRQLQVSLYSHISCVHDRITGVKGSHEKVLNALSKAIDLGIRVRAAVMLTRYNFKDIEDTVNWVEKKGIPFNYDFTLFKSENDQRRITDLRLPGHTISRLDRLMPKSRNPEKKIESCNMCRTQACISSKGEVFPCILFRKSAGSILEKTFGSIWNSPEMDKFRAFNWNSMKKCNTCSNRNYCFLCPGFNVTEGNLWFVPSNESCRVGLSRLGIY